ncbi:MAG: hypothetical protein C0595_04125 [Marinilabiliales bacterium]|nr:MAG: hypothetical protein C0595_04125 [Marinilabiliales bacterium]
MLNRNIKFFIAGISLIIILLIQACLKSKRPGLPEDVVSVISVSGLNKPQINRFILESMESEDSLKLHACYFIVSNLTSNYSAFYNLIDSSDNIVKINPESFKNLENIILYIDSLENSNGKLIYKADSFSLDFKRLNAKLLTDNLDIAFETYYDNKRYLNYDFETFKEYILPYRVENEVVEPFRKKLGKLYKLDTNIKFRDNIELINNKINSLVKYDERYVLSVESTSTDKLLKKGRGNLESINILKVKGLRSLGIAASIDYTPALSDTNGIYLWTSVLSPDGELILLDIKDGKLRNLLQNSIAKVYRRTFSNDTNSLFATKNIEENTPLFMGDYNYIDVSKSYNFNSTFISKSDTFNKYLYLSVYNYGQWKPIAWSLNENSQIAFNNLADNILYLPVKWQKNRSIAIDYPLILKDNKVEYFKVSGAYEPVKLTNYSPKGKLKANEEYDIYYWDFEWKLIESFKFTNDAYHIELPGNTLYRINNNDPFHYERIFSIKNGEQLFY